MAIVEIVGGILVALAVIVSVPVINKKCIYKYRYKPFNIPNALLMILSYLLLVAMMYFNTTAPKIFYTLSLYDIICLGSGIIIIMAIFMRITFATNVSVAIYATFLQLIGSIIIIPFLLLFYKPRNSDKKASV
jgi:hypothetical protein